MKTKNYNPSQLEKDLASAIMACKEQIQQNLQDSVKIVDSQQVMDRDNPLITFHLEDQDGDRHEIVIKVIQRPDTF